jgi:beta-lactamase class D
MRALSLVFVCATGCASQVAAREPVHPGCFLLHDLERGTTLKVHPEACARATVPASTFKLPHALIALQTGVVTDPDAVVAWDGVKRWREAWNQPHSLASAVHDSVVWFFQRTAEAIGRERMRAQLLAMRYGNAAVDGPLTWFWLDDGSLRVTGEQQLDFLLRMFRRELTTIDARHVDTLERMMITDRALFAARLPAGAAMPNTRATIRAKTGAATGVSWWVGRVTGPRGDFVFVSRVEPPGEPTSVSQAMVAGLAALERAGAL